MASDTLPIDPLLVPLVLEGAPTGSRVICNPPVLDSDEDWLLRITSYAAFRDTAILCGWEASSEGDPEYKQMPQFTSYRKGDVNLIVTESVEFYKAFDAATYVAARFNLRSKDDRIALFQAVLYGNKWIAALDSARAEEKQSK